MEMSKVKAKDFPANHPLHQLSNYDHCFLFADGLKDLRNVKQQLYSAADHFEDSYQKNDQKQMLLESLKDYISKSLIKTIDHLGCITNKVNNILHEHAEEVSRTKLRVICIEQRLRTCQTCANYGGLTQQSLMIQTPKYHKQYPIQEACIPEAEKAKKGYSGQTSTEFSLTNAASHKKLEKRSRSMSPLRFSIKRSGSSASQPTCPSFSVKLSASSVHRSISPNPSGSRQQQSPEAWKSQPLYPQRKCKRDMEIYSKKTRSLFKALLSLYRSKNNTI